MANEKPFKLDIPFDEALKRFTHTDEKEIPENKKLRKKRAGRSPPKDDEKNPSGRSRQPEGKD